MSGLVTDYNLEISCRYLFFK